MKTKRLLSTLSLLFMTLFVVTFAQVTKKVTVVQKGDSTSVTVDSLNWSGEKAITILVNDKMKEMENSDMDMVVQIDTLDDGKIVKKVIITSSGETPEIENLEKHFIVTSTPDDDNEEHIMVMSSEDMVKNEDGENVMVISSSDNDGEYVWHTKNPSAPKETLTPVAISDIHILKKAGFSTKSLTSEPLELKDLDINIKREKTSDSDILNFSMDITMPEKDKTTTVTLIHGDNTAKEVKTFNGSDKISVKYSMNKASVPYYIVVLQDKKMWTRKIDF